MNYVLSDTKEQKTLLEALYPIGAIYISLNPTSPASFLGGEWCALGGNQTLWATAWNENTTKVLTTGSTGDIKNAGLPNIRGSITHHSAWTSASQNGALKTITGYGEYTGGQFGQTLVNTIEFNAADSNSIYSDSCSTVQPPAQCVYMWRRSA